MPKSYPSEFRRRVIELMRAGATARVLADDLGVSEATIYRWASPGGRSTGESARGSQWRAHRALRARARGSRSSKLSSSSRARPRRCSTRARDRPAPKDLPGDRGPGRAGTQPREALPDVRVAPSGFYYWRSKPPTSVSFATSSSAV